ncbi:unnamed protein product [Adineta steineri]|uniref:G-protein coupled receptors family 1 profile domain-containing protein n=1 Tax=Adineta steineri TaxID=433720 RepID=A0A814KWF9_9BILA|nr:unnamed protein product [Adineta steineri]CAF4172337.1 unnamed protein product [Adineta steineri]
MSNNISTTTIDPAVARLNAVRIEIQHIGQPILLTLGMIGCILNIAIFLRPTMRTNSCAIYFHASSWANLQCLTWSLFISMLSTFLTNKPLTYNSAYCKIRYYILTGSQLASRACVVSACLDRYLLCSQSVRQRSFCRASVAIKVMGITITSCACLSIYLLVVYDALPQARQCNVSSAVERIMDTTVLFAFNFGTPALLMSALSALIIWRLKQNAKRIGHQRVHLRKRDLQLAAMLIGQVALYIITALPFVTNFVSLTVTQYDSPSSKSAYRVAAEALASTATGSFGTFIFNPLTFYVYTLTAPSFRRELSALIVPKRWMNRFQPKEHIELSRTNRVNPSMRITQANDPRI